MSRAWGTLIITLKSDMCASSGEGFSSGIDIDSCYDEYGYPIIPARRIKGCLRESALLIRMDQNATDALFGRSGAGVAGCLVVRDAEVVQGREESSEGVGPVIDRYTYVRAQTAIDTGTGSAKKNTLRLLRVVRHYVLGKHGFEELVFRARVCVDSDHLSDFEAAAVALRSMGLSRNRGFGAVRCHVEWDDAAQKDRLAATGVIETKFVESGRRMVGLSYVIRLDSPLMISRTNGNLSADYISGSSVRGHFASRLKESKRFEDLFLKGLVRFSPLYPVDGTGARCMPAPPFIIKIKGGKNDGTCRNALTYACAPGEMMKSLHSGYVDSSWQHLRPTTQIIYHHSRVGEGTLYTQRCLSKGQLMGGFIECPEGLANELLGVLRDGNLAFGRSKGAQYAACSVVQARNDFTMRDCSITLKHGSYALVLDSDALITRMEEGARYLASADALIRAVRDAYVKEGYDSSWMGRVDVLEDDDAEFDVPLGTSIGYRTIAGYNSKWNQKTPHERALAAGSSLVLRVPAGCEGVVVPKVLMVGDRQAEGFGRLVLVPLDEAIPKNCDNHHPRSTREASENESMRQRTIAFARDMRKTLECFTPSFVGRISLMVRESTSGKELDDRINSIKDDKKRESAETLVHAWRIQEEGSAWRDERECLQLILTLAKYFIKQKNAMREEVA